MENNNFVEVGDEIVVTGDREGWGRKDKESRGTWKSATGGEGGVEGRRVGGPDQ
jgi:hypothetical protein